MNAKLGNIFCYYRQAPSPYLTVVYSHSRIIIKWSSKMNHEEKVRFHFLEIWRTYIFLTVGLNDRDFIQVVSEQHLWISERSSDSQLASINCLWNNRQFEEFIELLPKKRIRLWVMIVRYGCREPSAELDLTGKLTKGMELLLCVSLPSQQQRFCVFLLDTGESMIPKTMSVIPKAVPRPSSYYHGQRFGISPYLSTFIKYLPCNVKTTWQHVI